MSEWISVEDKLPEHHQRVLIYYAEDDYIELGQYLEPKNYPPYVDHPLFFVDDSISFEIELISHWMPLPEPPK